MSTPESIPPQEPDAKQQHIIDKFGHILIKNPHHGRPGHENDPETILVSETPEKCLPFVGALLRAKDEQQVQAIIDIYKAE